MTQQNIKKDKKKHKKNKSKKTLLFPIIIIFVLILIFVLINKKTTQYNDKIQIILDNENITAKLKQEPIIENEQIYMSYDDIKAVLDPTLYGEEENNLIITVSDKKLGVIDLENQTLEINSSMVETKNISITKNNDIYLAISELQNVYNYDLNYIENTNIVTIDLLNKKSIKAYANKNLKLKQEAKFFSKKVDNINKGNWLYFIEEQNGYAKVRTQNGIIGFVKSKNLTNFIIEREDFVEKTQNFDQENAIKIDITKKDISTYEKRKEIINSILKDAVKNNKKYIQIVYEADNTMEFERFKIEAYPVFAECGIKAK